MDVILPSTPGLSSTTSSSKKRKKSKRTSTSSSGNGTIDDKSGNSSTKKSSSKSKERSSSRKDRKRSRSDAPSSSSPSKKTSSSLSQSQSQQSSNSTQKKKRTRKNGDDTSTRTSSSSSKRKSKSQIDDIKNEGDGETKVKVTPLAVGSSYSDTKQLASSKNVTIQVDAVSHTTNPIVVSFPSGIPQSTLHAEQQQQQQQQQKSSTRKTVSFQQNEPSTTNTNTPTFTWSKIRQSSTRGRTLHGHDRTNTYTSSNPGRGYDGRLTKLYIALYHKPTGTLRIVPAAERGTVFSLTQNVRQDDGAVGGLVDESTLSYDERRRLLFDSFGSTKKKRALRSQQANVVEMKSVVGAGDGMMDALGKQGDGAVSQSNLEAMEEVRKGEGDDGKGGLIPSMTTKAVQKAEDAARRSYLPPYDPTADAPHKVYDSQELAGEDAWNQISRQVDKCIHPNNNKQTAELDFVDDTQWIEALQRNKWFPSTQTLLATIKSPSQKRGAKYQIKTVVLVNQLLIFHTKFNKTFVPEATVSDEYIERGGDPSASPALLMAKYIGLPVDACTTFLALYTTPSHDRGKAGYAVTKQLKDKRVLHILVMYLLAHGRGMKVASIESLCDDLRIGVKEAGSLYRMAGCKMKKGKGGSTSVSLSVPLVFPPTGKRAARK